MFCTNCGASNSDEAAFCGQCGRPLVRITSPGSPAAETGRPQAPLGRAPMPPAAEQLAGLGQRAGSFAIDLVLQAIPYIGLVPGVINGFLFRRGTTIGLSIVSARIVRENGDVSGFYHTAVRGMAAGLSLIPLGLGYWWAFWDPMRQTWHDKIMHTYIVRDTPDLRGRKGTSSTAAVVIFWAGLAILLAILLVLVLLVVVALVGSVGL